MMHQVDIVLCTFNGEMYLAEQIDSILAQSHREFSLLIFDDNSSDSTIEIASNYAKKDRRIKIYRHSQRIGFVNNFEYGIKQSTAPYIALSDQDDIWHPDKLALQLEQMLKHDNQNKPILVNTDLTVVDKDGKNLHKSYLKLRNYQLPNKKYLHRVISYNGVMGCTILMNQKLKQQALPFPHKTHVHDYWLAVLNECTGTRITIDKPLVNYRTHQNSASDSTSRIRGISLKPKLPCQRISINTLYALLAHKNVSDKDKKLIKAFGDYLTSSKGPAKIIFDILRFKYFKFNPKLLIIMIAIFMR